MAYNIKPPKPDSDAPPYPHEAPFSGSLKPRRSSRRWVWIILGIVALVSILGCALLALSAVWAVTTYYNSPLRASDTYYSAIKNQDYSTAYTYLGTQLQKEYSQEVFTQAARQQDETLGRVNRFGMNNIPMGDPANVTLTVTRTNGTAHMGNTNATTYTVHLELRQEAGAWKITSFDRI